MWPLSLPATSHFIAPLVAPVPMQSGAYATPTPSSKQPSANDSQHSPPPPTASRRLHPVPFGASNTRNTDRAQLDVVSADTTGPLPRCTNTTALYLQIRNDHASVRIGRICIASKNLAPTSKQNMLTSWKNIRGKITKRLHSDNALELVGAQLRNFLLHQGTSAENGNSERAVRAVITHTRSNLLAAKFPETLWPHAVSDVICKLNATARKYDTSPPHERFHGRKPDTAQLLPLVKQDLSSTTATKRSSLLAHFPHDTLARLPGTSTISFSVTTRVLVVKHVRH
jgi:hypothetical protein